MNFFIEKVEQKMKSG